MTSTSSTKAEVTNLAKKLRDMEKRIEELETGNALHGTLPEGGTLFVRDSSGNLIAKLGAITPTLDGLQVLETGGGSVIIEANQDEGIVSPWLTTSWQKESDANTTTSGSWVSLWSTTIGLVWSREIQTKINASAPVGTDFEMKIVLPGQGESGVKQVTGDGLVNLYDFRWAHGLTLATGNFVVQLQARRTAGSGTVTVYAPYELSWGGNMSPVTGGWV